MVMVTRVGKTLRIHLTKASRIPTRRVQRHNSPPEGSRDKSPVVHDLAAEMAVQNARDEGSDDDDQHQRKENDKDLGEDLAELTDTAVSIRAPADDPWWIWEGLVQKQLVKSVYMLCVCLEGELFV